VCRSRRRRLLAASLLSGSGSRVIDSGALYSRLCAVGVLYAGIIVCR
jgi:hypothetical protein